MAQELTELNPSAFNDLLEHLSKKNIAINKERRNSGIGRSQCFGIVNKRGQPPHISRQSWLDPKLHDLLMRFARLNLPSDLQFTSIQVNCNYKCLPHYDKGNEGQSYIVGFGAYTKGELKLKDIGSFNIRHRPLLFDGSQIEHETEDYEGTRYTLVYHTLKKKKHPIPSLKDFEAKVVNGSWVIAWYQDGLPTQYLSKKNGLPHPLKARKKAIVFEPEEESNLTSPQQLMMRSRRMSIYQEEMAEPESTDSSDSGF